MRAGFNQLLDMSEKMDWNYANERDLEESF